VSGDSGANSRREAGRIEPQLAQGFRGRAELVFQVGAGGQEFVGGGTGGRQAQRIRLGGRFAEFLLGQRHGVAGLDGLLAGTEGVDPGL
jgi:hypothetical protein